MLLLRCFGSSCANNGEGALNTPSFPSPIQCKHRAFHVVGRISVQATERYATAVVASRPVSEYSLSPSTIGAHCRYILSPLPRLVPVTGTFSLPFRDWCPLWVHSLSPSAMGDRGYSVATRRRRVGCARLATR
eukprot:7900224-Pyramimonas_sp.AAC.1